MKKRCFVCLLAGALLVGALTGCGGKDGSDIPAGQDAEAASDEAAVTAAEEAAADAAEEDGRNGSAGEDMGSADTEGEDAGAVAGDKAEGTEFSFADVTSCQFIFSSGAGAWQTELYIFADGSFKGHYGDSDMGDMGEDYPGGTYYCSDFSGKFTAPEKVDDHTFQFEIEDINYERVPGTEEIKDGTRYICTEAYGLSDTEKFYMFLPGKPFDGLSDAALLWMGYLDPEERPAGGMTGYALYNVEQDTAFAGEEMPDPYELAQDLLRDAKERDAEIDKRFENDPLTQVEMNQLACESFTVWDDCLNEIWSMIKVRLPDEAFQMLLGEQREWIKEKERKVEEEAADYEGGSMQPLIIYGTESELTEKRAYELAEYLK